MEHLQQFSEYLSKEKKYSFYTVKSYTKDVQLFFQFLGDDIKVQDVDFKLVRKWIVDLSLQKNTHRTINRKISSLKAYFKFLYITHTIEKYPLELVRNLKMDKKIQIPFSESEMNEVNRSDFSNDFEGLVEYVIVTMFYNLGLRKSELISLRINDYQSGFFKILGKGNKERMVPVSHEFQLVIDNYIYERSKHLNKNSEEYFLLKKGQKLNQTFVYRLINNYFRGITSKDKRSPHILRHSFATHLIQNGAEINAVKELMGHASLSSTQVYVNNNIEELKRVYKQAHPRFNKED